MGTQIASSVPMYRTENVVACDTCGLVQRVVQAQGELSGALSRLLVVAENYPQLKSDKNFLELQAQLEGTENRIAVARQRYVRAVQELSLIHI